VFFSLLLKEFTFKLLSCEIDSKNFSSLICYLKLLNRWEKFVNFTFSVESAE